MNLIMHDIIVAGAGPGGTTAAKNLARRGFSVLILEKNPIPRDKPCGGWITPSVLELIEWDEKKLDEIFWSPIKGLSIYSPSLFSFTMKREKILSYGILREQFDHALLTDALSEGATVNADEAVKNVIVKDEKVIVQTKKNDYTCRLIIGADGTRSKVAECTKVRPAWTSSEIVLDLVSETKVPKKMIRDFYKDDLAFIFYNKGGGYNWIYPKINQKYDDACVNIGVGCQLSKIKNSRQMYQEHVQNLKQINLLPESITLAKSTGWTYATLLGPKKRTYGDRVLLVGDAGGFSSNIAGEGIRTAIITGKLAAESISSVPDFSKTSLKSYEKAWKRLLKTEYDIGKVLQQTLTREMDSIDNILKKLRDDIQGQEDLVKLLIASDDLAEVFGRLARKLL